MKAAGPNRNFASIWGRFFNLTIPRYYKNPSFASTKQINTNYRLTICCLDVVGILSSPMLGKLWCVQATSINVFSGSLLPGVSSSQIGLLHVSGVLLGDPRGSTEH
jgi:hypothetical protein